MNLRTTIHATRSTKRKARQLAVLYFVLFSVLVTTAEVFAWEIDLSRRRKNLQREDQPEATSKSNADTNFLENLLPASPGSQEIVILSTENGFVPRTVRVKKDTAYTVYVVNVNEKEKNVSFILDAFSEHHGTYYGKIKKFEITPRKEGVFSFYCPETSKEGRMVVYLGEPGRALSSQGE